ncbi:MAG: peptidoglycan DD-metalloendopeptidase family protein [Bacteroidales bacterium]
MSNISLSLFSIFTSIFLLYSCFQTEKNYATLEDELDTISEKKLQLLYGIDKERYEVIQKNVPRNTFLSDILKSTGLSNAKIHEVVVSLDTIFDVRKIKSGNTYTSFIEKKDSVNSLAYFVYEINMTDFFVCDFSQTDTVISYIDSKDIKKQEQAVKGTIETSLWNALEDKNVPPTLSLELSEIYAWTIDFFGLQKGDSFKVVFTENFVDSVSIGIDRIKYAEFTHLDDNIYAIPFEQDSIVDFFDSTGASLRKAFLKSPLRFSRISSHFSHARMHPVLRRVRPHHGIDYAAPTGTPVRSIGDGVVIKKGYYGGGGNMVKIKHNSTYTSAYLHLSRFNKNAQLGQRVKQGDIIGYVGSTGLSTGPHLDFRIYKNNSPINPLTLKSPPVTPVKEENKDAFSIVRDSIISILQNI